MRIAHTTSIYIPVPPPTHGGTELQVYLLTEELVRRGHDVTLYASGDSQVSSHLHAVAEHATLDDPTVTRYMDKELETRSVAELYRNAGSYDVIHAHWPTLAPYFAPFTGTPTVMTYHYAEPEVHAYYRREAPAVQPVCVSHRQAELLGEPDLPVIYNGLDVASVPFGELADDYLVLVARMIPSKGVAEAVRIAKQAGERLILIGSATDYLPWARGYFQEQVAPLVDGDQIVHVSELPNAEVLGIVSRAKAFLFPLQGEEPFGLAALEAMATGTPVIAFERGAMPELVEDGVSGFLVANDTEALAALASVGSLNRTRVREHVAERFGHERMVDSYEALYRTVTP